MEPPDVADAVTAWVAIGGGGAGCEMTMSADTFLVIFSMANTAGAPLDSPSTVTDTRVYPEFRRIITVRAPP